MSFVTSTRVLDTQSLRTSLLSNSSSLRPIRSTEVATAAPDRLVTVVDCSQIAGYYVPSSEVSSCLVSAGELTVGREDPNGRRYCIASWLVDSVGNLLVSHRSHGNGHDSHRYRVASHRCISPRSGAARHPPPFEQETAVVDGRRLADLCWRPAILAYTVTSSLLACTVGRWRHSTPTCFWMSDSDCLVAIRQ